MTDRIDALTEKQRDCLRLVWLQYDSKEIARRLGIKPDAVDGRLKTATKILGVGNRFEAARALAYAEAGSDVRRTVYPPSYIPSEALPPASTISFNAGEHQAEHLPIEEAQAPYRLSPAIGAGWFALPLPAVGRRTNDLSSGAKLCWVAAIAIGTALAFGVLASGLEALSRLG